jgi:hypothetical protein
LLGLLGYPLRCKWLIRVKWVIRVSTVIMVTRVIRVIIRVVMAE